ncbi:DUF4199 domain-containing protein [Streptomyces sp. t39]|uniref:DUF4199 domain-containing protein n=1 Tax=Streptomyces sp. t39 TaxID=1828156 RepID=UPI0011CD8006|nr:DUF4199 domain-containing protein [Streptomyces sp. t39]TXS55638.1 hypothetical protein EAO77_05240 [Streptomyces sp. t39]
MVRNVIGSVLALAGATAAVWSPFRAWYDGRPGRYYRVQDLFGGITGADAAIVASVLLPLAFGALIALLGVVLRSRLLVALAGLIVLGFTVLWMVRQGQAAGSLTVSGDGRGLGDGVAMAAGGGVLLLIAAVVMSGRPRSRGYEPRETHTAEPDDWGPYGPDATGPVPYRQNPYGLRPDDGVQPHGGRGRRGDEGAYGDGHGPDGPPTLPAPGKRDEW